MGSSFAIDAAIAARPGRSAINLQVDLSKNMTSVGAGATT
jgi:hypothetical protein